MKRMKLLVVVALTLVICLPVVASADYYLGQTIGGWFSEPNVPITFDRFDTYLTPGSETFSSATIGTNVATIDRFGDFASYGWTGIKINDTFSQATGGDRTTLRWDWNLVGSAHIPSGFTFDINYFNDGAFQLHEHYVVNAYQSVSVTNSGIPYSAVPLPPSVLLLGSGILGLVGLGWRRRQAS